MEKRYKKGITFGAFDPLHYGHIKLFERAKELCDYLIVCVSSPRYIKEVKNRDEYIPFYERIKAVEAIKYVDYVGYQNIRIGKKENVKLFKPDVIFVGDDWNKKTFTGEGLGVPIEYLPYTKGVSSTKLRK